MMKTIEGPNGVQSQSNVGTWLIVLSVLIPLIGVVVGVMQMLSAEPAKQELGKKLLIAAAFGFVLAVLLSEAFGI